MVFPDLLPQPDLISTVVFVNKMKWRTSNAVSSVHNSVTQKCL